MEIKALDMRLAKLLSIALLIFSIHTQALGQSNRAYRPNWGLKFNPLATIAYTPGIELGLEHTIRENASLHLGGSYLNDFGIYPTKNFDGYKLMGEYRHYQPFKKRHQNTFLALQFNFKQTFAQGQTYLDRANGNYQQLTEVSVTNTTLEFLGAYGKVFTLTPWLSLDTALALGLKRLNLSSDNVPPDAAFILFDDNIFDFTVNSFGSDWYPLLRLQLKFNIELFRD